MVSLTSRTLDVINRLFSQVLLMYVYIHIWICTYIHVRMCMCLCVCLCAWVAEITEPKVHSNSWSMYTFIYIYQYVYIYMYVCTYICDLLIWHQLIKSLWPLRVLLRISTDTTYKLVTKQKTKKKLFEYYIYIIWRLYIHIHLMGCLFIAMRHTPPK